jgi:hypothetical protein
MKTPREILLSRHRDVEPKLESLWRATLHRGLDDRADATERVPPVAKLWQELIWPCRRVWTGLACAWVLIIALHLASSEPATREASKTGPPSRDEMQAMVEQRRMLAQLIGEEPKPIDKHQLDSPGPRSERIQRTSAA